MENFEKAIRACCLFTADLDDTAKAKRFEDILSVVEGDTEVEEKLVKKYEKMLDLFCG